MNLHHCSIATLTVLSLLHLASATAEVALDPIAPRLANADPAKGEKIFLQCKACHVASPEAKFTVGPNLWGIVGRAAATEADYPYSNSLRQVGGVWDYEQLSRYLFNPRAMAPQTRMVFPGVKRADERAHLIAYLRTLSDDPLSLPEPQAGTEARPVYGNLPEGVGREAVYFTCRACHALKQFTQERKNREDWDALLDEMVKKNGMEAPEGWARNLMLDYLATHFGAQQPEDWQGLPAGGGREEVFYTCKACHSLMLVKQQGMDRDNWDETLEWMVEEQGMQEIENAATRELILDYLATHFGTD